MEDITHKVDGPRIVTWSDENMYYCYTNKFYLIINKWHGVPMHQSMTSYLTFVHKASKLWGFEVY